MTGSLAYFARDGALGFATPRTKSACPRVIRSAFSRSSRTLGSSLGPNSAITVACMARSEAACAQASANPGICRSSAVTRATSCKDRMRALSGAASYSSRMGTGAFWRAGGTVVEGASA